jgi:hypothetical protein
MSGAVVHSERIAHTQRDRVHSAVVGETTHWDTHPFLAELISKARAEALAEHIYM